MNVTSFFHTIFVAWEALTNTNQQRYKYWNCCAPVVSPKHKGLWNRIGIFSRLKRVCDTDIGCAMWGPSLHGPDTAKTLQVFADHDVGTAVGKGVFFFGWVGGMDWQLIPYSPWPKMTYTWFALYSCFSMLFCLSRTLAHIIGQDSLSEASTLVASASSGDELMVWFQDCLEISTQWLNHSWCAYSGNWSPSMQ